MSIRVSYSTDSSIPRDHGHVTHRVSFIGTKAAREGWDRRRGRLLPAQPLGAPGPQAQDLDELNAQLLAGCYEDEHRKMAGHDTTVGAAIRRSGGPGSDLPQ